MQYKIIDAHVHVFPDKIAEKAVDAIGKYYNIKMDGIGTVKDLLFNGPKAGISKFVIHSTATRVEQVVAINNFIGKTKKSSQCFIGLGTLHPDLEDIDSEVNRIISMGLKGIKLHPEFQGFAIDDDNMMPIYQALEGKLPVLIHMGDEVKTSSSPKRLAKVLEMFPKLTFIAAHMGGYRMWDESIKYLVGKNVYFDTSSTLFMLEKDKFTRILRTHGVEKVLFGTDYPMWSQQEELERFFAIDLTEEERELILWKNASQLFNESL
jgi:predicted TIM-barrel fold metal-dependent hydrolase